MGRATYQLQPIQALCKSLPKLPLRLLQKLFPRWAQGPSCAPELLRGVTAGCQFRRGRWGEGSQPLPKSRKGNQTHLWHLSVSSRLHPNSNYSEAAIKGVGWGGVFSYAEAQGAYSSFNHVYNEGGRLGMSRKIMQSAPSCSLLPLGEQSRYLIPNSQTEKLESQHRLIKFAYP